MIALSFDASFNSSREFINCGAQGFLWNLPTLPPTVVPATTFVMCRTENVSATHHKSASLLEPKLEAEWAKILQETLHATVYEFLRRIEECIKAQGDHFENSFDIWFLIVSWTFLLNAFSVFVVLKKNEKNCSKLQNELLPHPVTNAVFILRFWAARACGTRPRFGRGLQLVPVMPAARARSHLDFGHEVWCLRYIN